LILYGCPTTYKFGQKFDKKNIEQIVIGRTTQAEVEKLFGTPWREGNANGNIVFTYSYENVVFESNNNVTKTGDTLVIEFDKNGTVENYYLNIPGKEPVILGYMLHKREEEKKQQQAAQQNNMAMQHHFPPANIRF
jgi:outer membrane protein assembly factor BamE (lipoprotein component of BamABCDE complex)